MIAKQRHAKLHLADECSVKLLQQDYRWQTFAKQRYLNPRPPTAHWETSHTRERLPSIPSRHGMVATQRRRSLAPLTEVLVIDGRLIRTSRAEGGSRKYRNGVGYVGPQPWFSPMSEDRTARGPEPPIPRALASTWNMAIENRMHQLANELARSYRAPLTRRAQLAQGERQSLPFQRDPGDGAVNLLC